MKALLNKAGFSKRSGTPIYKLVYVLVLWVWLKKDSIGMFARESLQHFTTAEKDALYSIMNRESDFCGSIHVGSPLVILVGGTSNIIPFRRPFFFLIQLVVVLI
jgi:hypothetical protein